MNERNKEMLVRFVSRKLDMCKSDYSDTVKLLHFLTEYATIMSMKVVDVYQAAINLKMGDVEAIELERQEVEDFYKA